METRLHMQDRHKGADTEQPGLSITRWRSTTELPQSWQTKFRSSLKTEKLLKFCMSAVWDVTQGNNTTKTRQTSGIQNLIPLRHTRDYKRDAITPKISHHKFTHIHVFYVHLNGQKQNAIILNSILCRYACVCVCACTPTYLSLVCDETGMPPTGSIKYYSLKEIFFFRLR